MSDLETRLAAALSAGASEALPPVGLADGARRRLRARRRTRGLAGGVLAVLLVAVPGGVLLARDGGPSPADEVVVDGAVEGGWRTVSYGGVEVDVPADWTRLDPSDCEFAFQRVGPPDSDPCDPATGVAFYGSDTFDPKELPGLLGREGYVSAGDWAVHVVAPGEDVAWRVLASARVAGEEIPDLAQGTTEIAEHGLVATVPADPAGWSLTSVPDAAPRHPTVLPRDGRWVGRAGLSGGSMVVDAGTQGLAELVAASVARAPGADDGWRTETWNGLSIEVPSTWTPGPRGSWCADGSPEQGRVQRPGTWSRAAGCSGPILGFGVTFGRGSAMELAHPSGHVWRYERGDVEQYRDGSWLGHWYDEGRLVQVNAGDRETVQQILDSLRSADR